MCGGNASFRRSEEAYFAVRIRDLDRGAPIGLEDVLEKVASRLAFADPRVIDPDGELELDAALGELIHTGRGGGLGDDARLAARRLHKDLAGALDVALVGHGD